MIPDHCNPDKNEYWEAIIKTEEWILASKATKDGKKRSKIRLDYAKKELDINRKKA